MCLKNIYLDFRTAPVHPSQRVNVTFKKYISEFSNCTGAPQSTLFQTHISAGTLGPAPVHPSQHVNVTFKKYVSGFSNCTGAPQSTLFQTHISSGTLGPAPV